MKQFRTPVPRNVVSVPKTSLSVPSRSPCQPMKTLAKQPKGTKGTLFLIKLSKYVYIHTRGYAVRSTYTLRAPGHTDMGCRPFGPHGDANSTSPCLFIGEIGGLSRVPFQSWGPGIKPRPKQTPRILFFKTFLKKIFRF